MKKIYITNSMSIYVFKNVYEPSDDTWLLMELVEPRKINGKVVVDTCSGTGILGIYSWIIGRPRKIVFIDISEQAIANIMFNIKHLNLCDYLILRCDLLRCLNEHSVDVVLANPPYLPGIGKDLDLYGGVHGYEIILDLIIEANRVLRNRGSLFLVYSSLSNEDIIIDYLHKYGFKVYRKKSKHFSFEDIIAIEAIKEN